VYVKKLLLILALIALPAYAFAGTIERVSLTDSGVQANNSSFTASNSTSNTGTFSSDGRHVAFESYATNLVTGDTNSAEDVFVYDRNTDTIERLSVSDAGVQGNADSLLASISGDGRYVAFISAGTNLVAGDINNQTDVFVYDRNTDTIERVSVSSLGAEANGSSYDRVSISSDGRYVGFTSYATNLIAGDTNGAGDVFVYDRTADTIERVSVSDLGAEGDGASFSVALSTDGRYVAFESYATNFVAGDTNAWEDVFVYDRNTDTIERVSVNDLGAETTDASNPSVSSDGRYVAFESAGTNLVAGDTNNQTDVFVYDRNTDTVERVNVSDTGTETNSPTSGSAISSDGRYVAFVTAANNLDLVCLSGDRQVFVYDRTDDVIECTSLSDAAVQGNAPSFPPASISSDGRYVGFASDATNLVADDVGFVTDLFVWDRGAPPDTDAPVITILGDNPATVTEGDTYTDAGATAEDDTDGDITADINTTNSVNTAVIGSYDVVYDVTDAADNTAYATRTVNVIEEESGGGGVSRRHPTDDSAMISTSTPPTPTDTAALIRELQLKLIDLLQQWVALLMEGR
jgi:hypothetical protein